MTVRELTTLVVAVGLAFGGALGHAQAQKPVRTIQPHSDGDPVPATLNELVQGAELVVLGTVVAERAADRTIEFRRESESYTLVRTAYRLKLKESFLLPKRLKTPVSSIEVGIYNVGDRDRGDHIARYVSESARGLKVGETYLLFLRADVDEVWRLATDNGNSIVGIKGAATAPQAASRLALEIAGKSWTTLRRELLAMVKKEVGR